MHTFTEKGSRRTASDTPLSGRYGTSSPQTFQPALPVRGVLESRGQPLEPSIRMDMESYFQFDFSQVRVHHNDEARAAAKSLGARAFSFQNHIVVDSAQ